MVDDEPLSATVVEMFLSDRGHPVLAAHSGSEAQDRAADFGPDVVLTDYRLGDMSAAELIRRLRVERPALRAIVLTGLPPEEVANGLGDLGQVQVFIKPTELEEIAAAIADSTPA